MKSLAVAAMVGSAVAVGARGTLRLRRAWRHRTILVQVDTGSVWTIE